MWGTYSPLVIWDTKTGVVVREAYTQHCGKILFYGDQKMITLVHEDQDFYMYDTLSNVQLFQCEILPSQGSGFGACWVFEDTLRFAISHQTGGRLVINICELQQTLTPPFCVVSLFQVPPHEGEFSFSPVSFHASFVTQTEVIILDVQDSKLLLHTTVVLKYSLPLGQFSPNGCFFIYETLESEICVWQNTATGYIPWSTLRPRLCRKNPHEIIRHNNPF